MYIVINKCYIKEKKVNMLRGGRPVDSWKHFHRTVEGDKAILLSARFVLVYIATGQRD